MRNRAGRQDLPARELVRQLAALPAAQYEFAVFDGRTTRRVWRARQALRSLGWLRHRNDRGAHVQFRPATTACVLVDDLSADAARAMAADGLAPAAVVEAAPGEFQAWFRLGRELGPKLGRCAAQVLAARYGGDPASVDLRRLGRAAGFTNRGAEYTDADGRYPRVRLTEARGRVTPRADELVAAAEERLREREARRREAAAKTERRRTDGEEAGAFLAGEVARLARRHGSDTDRSRAAAVAARRMALAGFGQDDIVAALAASPELGRLRAGRVGDHAARTAAWAFGGAVRRPR